MSLHEYKGVLYCDASDLRELLSRNTLYRYLSKDRRYGGHFQNIANSFYNNRNSRRWVLLVGIPPELREQIEQNIRKSSFSNHILQHN